MEQPASAEQEQPSAPVDVKVTAKRPAEPEYVVVTDSVTNDAIELPTQTEDNTLGLGTLGRAFPGAHGLKYKNPDTGAMRALLIDSSGAKFYPPPTGWSGKVFTVIYNKAATFVASPEVSNIRTNSDQNAKRKKMMDDDDNDPNDAEKDHVSGQAKQKRIDSGETATGGVSDDKVATPAPAAPTTTPKTAAKTTPAAAAATTPKAPKHQAIDDDDDHPSDLIVLGIPYKLSEDELRAYFEPFGELVLCEIKKDIKGSSKGFGFIQFATVEAQEKVLQRSHHTIGGRKCQVKVPLSKKSDGKGDAVNDQHAKMFVGRLQEKTGEGTLRTFFLAEGRKVDSRVNVVDVFIPKPFRSFAFVTFSSAKVARELIKKGDFIIEGSSVSVSSAAPKVDSFTPPGPVPLIRDFDYTPWNRNAAARQPMHSAQALNSRFTDSSVAAAYMRPFEQQRKRTFMERTTGYSSPLPSVDMSGGHGGGPPGGYGNHMQNTGGQALASGFETLNINRQMPPSDVMPQAPFSHYFQLGPPQQQQQPPPMQGYQNMNSSMGMPPPLNSRQRVPRYGGNDYGSPSMGRPMVRMSRPNNGMDPFYPY